MEILPGVPSVAVVVIGGGGGGSSGGIANYEAASPPPTLGPRPVQCGRGAPSRSSLVTWWAEQRVFLSVESDSRSLHQPGLH